MMKACWNETRSAQPNIIIMTNLTAISEVLKDHDLQVLSTVEATDGKSSLLLSFKVCAIQSCQYYNFLL